MITRFLNTLCTCSRFTFLSEERTRASSFWNLPSFSNKYFTISLWFQLEARFSFCIFSMFLDPRRLITLCLERLQLERFS